LEKLSGVSLLWIKYPVSDTTKESPINQTSISTEKSNSTSQIVSMVLLMYNGVALRTRHPELTTTSRHTTLATSTTSSIRKRALATRLTMAVCCMRSEEHTSELQSRE